MRKIPDVELTIERAGFVPVGAKFFDIAF